MNNSKTLLYEKPKYFTPGVIVITILAGIGLLSLLARFIFGIGAVTNLDDQYPWGIWIAIDVACGVALAAGGFMTAFLAHIIHGKGYKSIIRPAILTAMLGYTFVALGVFSDLGRYYNIWHVLVPIYWNPNSVLLEVGLCVLAYVTVLYIEFIPVVIERFLGKVNLPGRLKRFNKFFEWLLNILDKTLSKLMSIFIILGVVLSCMHQSSLGTLMAIANTKLHPLWHTPVLPLLFLLSAFVVGFAMVVFESLIASRSFKLKPEINVLSRLARFIPILLIVYFGAKLMDLVNRETYVYLFDGSIEGIMFAIEMIVGIVVPFIILMFEKYRKKPIALFIGAALVVFGVALNRINVFIIGFTPLYAKGPYIPAWTEVAVTVGFISLIILLYRFFAFYFPVIEDMEN
ncbi:MAG: Ni/Fe-hydrogenase cytochrome b subunit [Bacteroidetes bacterium]|nr:MAG: Ni/Fe-hydrogenase cytochrome b subunit [Bacteroidota bacterium]